MSANEWWCEEPSLSNCGFASRKWKMLAIAVMFRLSLKSREMKCIDPRVLGFERQQNLIKFVKFMVVPMHIHHRSLESDQSLNCSSRDFRGKLKELSLCRALEPASKFKPEYPFFRSCSKRVTGSLQKCASRKVRRPWLSYFKTNHGRRCSSATVIMESSLPVGPHSQDKLLWRQVAMCARALLEGMMSFLEGPLSEPLRRLGWTILCNGHSRGSIAFSSILVRTEL